MACATIRVQITKGDNKMYSVLELYDKDNDAYYPVAYSQDTKILRTMGIALEQLVKNDMIVNHHYNNDTQELEKEPFDSVRIRSCVYDENIDLSKTY